MSDPPLFIRLYLDEDVSVLIARLLRSHGFDALTTQEAGQLGQTDIAQLRYATTHQRVLRTHHRVDYERLHTEALQKDQPHGGMLIASRRPSDFELARRVMTLLDRFTTEEVVNQLLYL